MRIIVLGGDGYLGWPTAMHLAARGHEVWTIDNYLRRQIALETCSEPLIATPNLVERAEIFAAQTGHRIRVTIGDCTDYPTVARLFREAQPDAVIHYAEQPSAPFSMLGYDSARRTLRNNLEATFNTVWACLEHAPACHIIKLGTMGEYGTPDIDIEEGWLEIEHKGRKDRFLYPRAAGSLYHTTKVLDTDLLWFYVRIYSLRVTDLMQGPVYGLATAESEIDERLVPNFHYDDIFGTVVNRFLVQAVAGVPLTVYGGGGQTRGYLNLCDTLQCIELAALNPPARGEMRILNQFTETFTVSELAQRVARAARALGLGEIRIESIPNPRKEREQHYYNPAHTGLIKLGLEPHYLTDEVLAAMLEKVRAHADRIDPARIMPRVRWNPAAAAP
jgi:UDP-sulfoquinovose synthase